MHRQIRPQGGIHDAAWGSDYTSTRVISRSGLLDCRVRQNTILSVASHVSLAIFTENRTNPDILI